MPAEMAVPFSPPPRVLVVEDEAVVRATLAAWFHTEGCQAEVAVDARTAELALAAREFDLLLCDVNLPDRDGPELVAAIKEPNRGLPVIFLTGEPRLETAIRSVQLRVVAYLVKPPDLDELGALVRREVAAHRQRRAVAASRRHLREWDAELAGLEQTLEAATARPAADYLQVTVRHFAAQLVELDRAFALLATDEAGHAVLAKLDVVTSLRRTVQVLERTREHFKSKDLGELRKDLEQLLRRIDGPSGPAAKSPLKS
jgi:DNA-binding response OmpR family regulator